MRKGTVAPHPIRAQPVARPLPPAPARLPRRRSDRNAHPGPAASSRPHARPADVVLATTGYTGRELYALDDRPSQLYMVGSMGCAPSLGARPRPGPAASGA